MIEHKGLGQLRFTQSRRLSELIRKGTITFAGNKRLKIFGRLQCISGKKMNIENRVFFSSIYEAEEQGYRPCGHCMKAEYLLWKKQKNEHSN